MNSADNAPLQREEIDLTGLAAEECARTGAQLQVQAQPTVHGDARLLHRLIRNLLENARRHGSQGKAGELAEVDLWLDRVELAGAAGVAHARITVDDRGPGVPVAQHRAQTRWHRALRRASRGWRAVCGGASAGTKRIAAGAFRKSIVCSPKWGMVRKCAKPHNSCPLLSLSLSLSGAKSWLHV